MDLLKSLPVDNSAARLIGHPGIVAAVTLCRDGAPVDRVGIVAPGFEFGDEWCVVHQMGTSPDDPDAGTSAANRFDTLKEAIAEFDDIVSSPDTTVALPFYVVVCPKKDGGRPLYVERDRFAGGAGFTDYASSAAVSWSAKGASGALRGARSMKTYNRADTVDFDALHVQQGLFLTRRVDLGSLAASEIAERGKGARAPDGWRYVVSDERVTTFLRPDKLGGDMGDADMALPFEDLAQAHAAAVEENAQVALLRKVVDGPTLTADMLAAMAVEEDAVLHPGDAPEVEPVKELRGVTVFRPFP